VELNMKHQHSTSNIQTTSKLQAPAGRKAIGLLAVKAPRGGKRRSAGKVLKFGAWCFSGCWMLRVDAFVSHFGIWSFSGGWSLEFGASAAAM
jgi:hypothetical protein